MLKYSAAALVALMTIATTPAHAAEWGDPAAPLALEAFVKGDPITLAEGKGEKIYVVEFWATWCGPCRTSIPHLTEMQKKYADDVVFIGVSDETVEAVEPFVADMGDKMDYRVAIDKDRATSMAYMGAYGQSGIPTAFIVDKKGRVAWVGHPATMEAQLESIVKGDYDIETVIAEKAAAEAGMKEFENFLRTIETNTPEKVFSLARIYLDDKETHYTLLANAGWAMIQHEALEERDYELSKSLLERAVKGAEKNPNAPLSLYYNALALANHKTGDLNGAIANQTKAVELEEDEPYLTRFKETLAAYEAERVTGPSI